MSPSGRSATEGVIVVDKPAGMTSHDVVDEVRRRFHTKKVGHAGTLDPDATGVLVLGVGRATRLLPFTQGAPKRYRAGLRFGVTTDTQDASGAVLEERLPSFTEEDLLAVLTKFTGQIEQVPPMVSAVKVGGERLYKKARRGEEVERPLRRVTVYSLEPVSVDLARHAVHLDVECSGGTYVRTLAHDIGETLGCGAHLTSLRRTSSGGFTEDDAVILEDLSPADLRPLEDAVRDLVRLDVGEEDARAIGHGRALPLRAARELDSKEGDHIAVFHGAELLAVYVCRKDVLAAARVLSQ